MQLCKQGQKQTSSLLNSQVAADCGDSLLIIAYFSSGELIDSFSDFSTFRGAIMQSTLKNEDKHQRKSWTTDSTSELFKHSISLEKSKMLTQEDYIDPAYCELLLPLALICDHICEYSCMLSSSVNIAYNETSR